MHLRIQEVSKQPYSVKLPFENTVCIVKQVKLEFNLVSGVQVNVTQYTEYAGVHILGQDPLNLSQIV